MCRCEAVKKEFYPELFLHVPFQYCKCGVKSVCFPKKYYKRRKTSCAVLVIGVVLQAILQPLPHSAEGGLKSIVAIFLFVLASFQGL